VADCDESLQTISKYNEKLTRFEEMIRQMKSNLYGSLETIANKVTRSVVTVDLPKRGVPRIISDVQLVPPRPITTQGLDAGTHDESEPFSDLETWTEVTNKRSRKRQVRINAARNDDVEESMEVAAGVVGAGNNDRRLPPSALSNITRRRAPRNAAVAIKTNPDGMSYAEIIKQAREEVNLKDLGITNPWMRRAANGGVLIEISGPEGAAKELAAHLRDAIGGSAVVSRPVIKADVRVTGFDESVIKDEIITMMMEFGECVASDVRVGPFPQMRNRLNMTWIQCPLSAALKVSRKGRDNLGWSVARVELLKAGPVQCYKCWHFEHVKNNYNFPMDRIGHCFKCVGGTNHSSYTCLSNPYCVTCADLG